MYQKPDRTLKRNVSNQNINETTRYLNPSDVNVPAGYAIEVFVQELDSPISMLFDEDGNMIIAESGFTSGNPRVLRLVNGNFEIIADGFNIPITGLNYLDGIIYVSHRGVISKIDQNGERQNIIAGLPSNGDYYNSRVVFGTDNKIYFGQGTATNSGVVGLDNGDWVTLYPLSCDYPGDYILLNGQNFASNNMLTIGGPRETVYTGAFSPYGVSNVQFEVRKGLVKASGSILRANLDGTNLELYAWGFRNPSYMRFDELNRLYVSNNGYEVRGSRPIANALDEFFLVLPGVWYGWPDYSGGEPVTSSKFRPEGGRQPEFLLRQHPNPAPAPFATFPANSGLMGFDFDYSSDFGPYGDAYIAEYGISRYMTASKTTSFTSIGHKISRIDMNTGVVSTFAINKSGHPASLTLEGGFNRPSDVLFGPDGAMYVLDLGLNIRNEPNVIIPNTGVVWRIYKI